MGLEVMGDLVLSMILEKLGPKDTARVAILSHRLRASASEDSLWSKFCSKDLDLSSPLDPDGNPVPSFKKTYQIWREAFGMYPWPLVKRVKRCWDVIKNWSAVNFPEVSSTLRKGASEAEIQEFEKFLKVKLPLPTRVLYRFCDGQECKGPVLTKLFGIMGGYTFYQHLVNVYLLPLRRIIVDTREIVRELGFSTTSKYIVVASSCTYNAKYFFLNCSNGQLYVGTGNLLTDGEMMPCVPSALVKSVHDVSGDQQQDALLLWLEEHGRRLQSGMIKVLGEGNRRSINLYPDEPPLCPTAITNGVKVRGSAVLVPEMSDLECEPNKYLFSYSIRMSLHPEGCIVKGTHFESCQLHRRHLIFRANETVVSNVNDEAVIGKYPLLLPGKEEFVYQSCTPLSSSAGSLEGGFTFVPGRLAIPKGASFEAELPKFPLQFPEYIF